MLFGTDIVWGAFVVMCIGAWFLGAGAVAVFILKFKPTRRLVSKFFNLD